MVFNPDKRFNTQQSLVHSYFDAINNTTATTNNINSSSSSQDSGISSQPCSAPLIDEDVGGSSQDSGVAHPCLLATDETLDSGIGSGSSNSLHLLNMSNQSNSNVDCRSLSRTDSGICMSPTPSTSSSVNNLSTSCSEIVSSGEFTSSSSSIVDKGNTPSIVETANVDSRVKGQMGEPRVIGDQVITTASDTNKGLLLATVETDLAIKDQQSKIKRTSDIIVNDHQDTTASGMNKNESDVTSTIPDVATQSKDSDLNSSNSIQEPSEGYKHEHSNLTTSSDKDLCNNDDLQHLKSQNENSASLKEKITTKKRGNVDDEEDVELPPSKMRRC